MHGLCLLYKTNPKAPVLSHKNKAVGSNAYHGSSPQV